MVRRRQRERSLFEVLLPDGHKLWPDWLRKIDTLLEDEAVIETVAQALEKRWPESRRRGRPGTPAEIVLRMLILKHLFDWSFDELEREVRGKVLQLRVEYTASGPHPKALGALLENSARTFFVLFRAVLRLRGRVPPREPAELVQGAAQVVGFDAGAFDWVLARLAGRKVPDLTQFDPVAERYLAATGPESGS